MLFKLGVFFIAIGIAKLVIYFIKKGRVDKCQ